MAIGRLRLCILSLVLAGFTQGPAHAGKLRKVWDLDLKTVIEAAGFKPTRDLPVLALRFSPDGGNFAAVVDLYGYIDGHRSRDGRGSYLVVSATGRPASRPRVFSLDGGLEFTGDNGTGPDVLEWLPSGLAIHVGENVFDMEKGKRCEVPWRGFFVTDSLLIALDTVEIVPVGDYVRRSHFKLLGSDCQPLGQWDVPEPWDLKDVSPDRGLLSVSAGLLARMENLIVDPINRKVLHRWPETQVPTGAFADGSGSDMEESEIAPVACWAVDTGKKIAQAPTLNGGDPMETATRATRIAATDVHRRKIPFSYEYTRVLKRRVVWDFGSGKELVSWCPQYQSYDFQLNRDPKKPLKHVHESFRFTISPDGQYILEGGGGALHLYKIEP